MVKDHHFVVSRAVGSGRGEAQPVVVYKKESSLVEMESPESQYESLLPGEGNSNPSLLGF